MSYSIVARVMRAVLIISTLFSLVPSLPTGTSFTPSPKNKSSCMYSTSVYRCQAPRSQPPR
jgi:hypothetical protein